MKKKGPDPFESYRPMISKFDIEQRLLGDTEKVLDIDAVLEKQEFTKEELLIAELILAEQAYLSDFEKIGNKLVNHVIKTKNKSKDVLFYLHQLEINKKLCLVKAKSDNKYVLVKQKKVRN